MNNSFSSAHTFPHSFVFGKHFILGSIVVDPEPIVLTQGVRWESKGSVYRRTPNIHTFTHITPRGNITPPIDLEGGKKTGEPWENPARGHTELSRGEPEPVRWKCLTY